MEEYQIKTKVVGVDISNERTTYAIVDMVAMKPYVLLVSARQVQVRFLAVSRMQPTCHGKESCLWPLC